MAAAAYIAGASVIVVALFVYRPATTWPGLAIVAAGVPIYLAMRWRNKARAADLS